MKQFTVSPERQLTQLQKRLSLTVYLCSGCCFPKNALYTNFAPEVISAGAKLTSIHKNHVVRSHVTWMFCSKENKEYFPSLSTHSCLWKIHLHPVDDTQGQLPNKSSRVQAFKSRLQTRSCLQTVGAHKGVMVYHGDHTKVLGCKLGGPKSISALCYLYGYP